jgi:hypothetical protein
MLPLAIWLFLVGYTIAIAGKRNLGVSYQPQADGSIKPVDAQGNPAKTYSLMDVVSCAQPSGTPAGTPAGSSSTTRSSSSSVQGPGGPFQVRPGALPWQSPVVVQNQQAQNAPSNQPLLSPSFQPPMSLQGLFGLPTPARGSSPLSHVWAGLKSVLSDLGSWFGSHR